MKIKIKSLIPIRYTPEELVALCQSFDATYVSNEQQDYELTLEIEETLTQEQVVSIVSQMKANVIANLITAEII
jgi:hypothetical protein